jgi:hypothetical protein
VADAAPGDGSVVTNDLAPRDDSGTDATVPDVSVAETSPVLTGPQVCGYTPCAAGAPCADLSVDQDDLRASVVIDTRMFQPTDCAMLEGCITQTGMRRLLHFDTGTINVGTADLYIGAPLQHACFQWSDCHQHYHFKGVGRYTLYQADGVTVAAVGHKQGFCLEDVDPMPSLNPPPAVPATPFTCDNQGLHVGWRDIYPNNIDCQWIDITGVAPGSYVLSVIVNADHYMPESNYANNEARATVTIPAE